MKPSFHLYYIPKGYICQVPAGLLLNFSKFYPNMLDSTVKLCYNTVTNYERLTHG